ncbi:MAG: N-acetyltransferase DgcN [Rhodospirillales bacterium]
MALRTPYLMFIGDAADHLAAKTARGVVHWRPEWCLGQLRLDGCNADLGIPDMTLEEAAAAGVKTLIVGVANRGGVISEAWSETLVRAIELGMDIASGLHSKLGDVPAIAAAAEQHSRALYDVRHPTREFSVGSGVRRGGKRMLAVGTDCSLGKMYTALACWREMEGRGVNCDFRATGQTGIFIAGEGVSVDAVVADFIAGSVEWLAPENSDDHWDLVEGQGSLFHPSYAGVSLGLLHGAQADALVMCHEPGRSHMRGIPHLSLPSLEECIRVNEEHARLTNPDAKVVGLAFNTSSMSDADAEACLKEHSDRFGMPAVDPVRTGVASLVDAILA